MPDPIDRILAIAGWQDPEQPAQQPFNIDRPSDAIDRIMGTASGRDPYLEELVREEAQKRHAPLFHRPERQKYLQSLYPDFDMKAVEAHLPAVAEEEKNDQLKWTVEKLRNEPEQDGRYLAERIPILRSIVPVADALEARRAAAAFKSGEYNQTDLDILARPVVRAERAKAQGLGGDLVDSLTAAPAMIAEWVLSGPAGAAGKKGATALAERGLGQAAKTAVGGLATRAAGVVGEGAARTAVLAALKTPAGVAERQQANPEESIGASAAKQLGADFIENTAFSAGHFPGMGEGTAKTLAGKVLDAVSGTAKGLLTAQAAQEAQYQAGVGEKPSLIHRGLQGQPVRDEAIRDILTFGAIEAISHSAQSMRSTGQNPTPQAEKIVENAMAQQQAKLGDLQKMTDAELVKLRNDLMANQAGLEKDLGWMKPTPESTVPPTPETPVQSPPATGAERPPVEPLNSPPGQEIVAPERSGAFSDLGKEQQVRKALGDIMGKAKIEAWAEEQQHSLADLDDAGVTPTAYWNRFFEEVYPRLPEHAQKHIDSQVAGIFNLRPGDVKGVRTDRETGAKTDVHVKDAKDVDGFGDFGSFEDMIREGGWTKPMRGLALKMGTLEQLVHAQTAVPSEKAPPLALPPSPLDRLRARQQPVESKPQPKRNGLQSLFPEAPAEEPAEPDHGEVGASKYRDNAKVVMPQDLHNMPEGKGGDRAGVLRLPAVDISAATEKVAAWLGEKHAGKEELEGAMYPRTAALSPEAADAMARSTSAARFGEMKGDRVVENVKAAVPGLVPGDEQFYGKVYQQWRHETAERNLRVEATRLMQEANAASRAGDQKEYLRLLKKGNEALKKATQVVSLIGPNFTQGEYQAGLADPKFQAIVQAWQKEGVPFIESELRKAKGLGPKNPIPTLTQIPGAPISVIAAAHDMPGATRTTRRGELTNPRQRTASAAREAGLNAPAYNTDLWEMMRQSVSKRTGPAAQREAYRILQESQVANRGEPNQKVDGWTEFKDVFPKKKGRADSLYVRDEAAGEVRKWFDVDKPSPRVAAKVFTFASLASTQEAFTHGRNLIRGAFEPGWTLWNVVNNIGSRLLNTGYAKDKLTELTRIAAQKPEGLITATITKGKLSPLNPVNPMTWTRKGLDFANDVQRMTLDDAYSRLVRKGLAHDTENGRRNFINKSLGQYERRAQHDLVRLARDTGIGPFATAGVTGWMANLRALTGSIGVPATSRAASLELRVNKLARLLALPALALVYNLYRWGRADGDDSVPFFAVKTGVDENGRSEYLDINKLNPLLGMLRQFGVLGFAEEKRHEGTTAGAINRGGGDVLLAGTHPFLGPAAELAHTAYTGRDHFGGQIAPAPGPEGTQLGQNLQTAALGLNPGVKAAEPWVRRKLDMEPVPEKKSDAERAAGLLGDFRFKYSRGEGGQHLSDAYELKKQYLARTGRADESAPQASAIAPLRDAALADDADAFRKAWQAYRDRAKAAGKSAERFDHDFGASLRHLDPLASLSDDDKGRFYRSLSVEQKKKVDQARGYAEEVRKKIVRMIPKAK